MPESDGTLWGPLRVSRARDDRAVRTKSGAPLAGAPAMVQAAALAFA